MKHLIIAKVKRTAAVVADAVRVTKAAIETQQKLGLLRISVNRVGFYGQTPVYLDNDAILAETFTWPHIPNAIFTNNIIGKAAIIVNQGFDDLPEDLKTAVFVHEEGHIVNKHRRSALYGAETTFGFGKGLQMEYEADAYAQAKGENILGYLEHMVENHPSHDVRGIRLRIKRLRELNNVSN